MIGARSFVIPPPDEPGLLGDLLQDVYGLPASENPFVCAPSGIGAVGAGSTGWRRIRDGTSCWAGVPLRIEQYDGSDPLAYVLCANHDRRQLNESQPAMAAARLASLPNGVRADRSSASLQSLPPISQPEAAKPLRVSTRSVTSAVAVRDNGIPELIAAVEAGTMSASLAADRRAGSRPPARTGGQSAAQSARSPAHRRQTGQYEAGR